MENIVPLRISALASHAPNYDAATEDIERRVAQLLTVASQNYLAESVSLAHKINNALAHALDLAAIAEPNAVAWLKANIPTLALAVEGLVQLRTPAATSALVVLAEMSEQKTMIELTTHACQACANG